MTVKTWLEHYLFSFKKNKIKNSTFMYYNSRFESLKPLYGIELSELSLFDIQNFINEYQQEHSYSTVRGSIILLRQACNKAVHANLLKHNPCDGVELPARNRREIDCLSEFELQQLFRTSQRSFYYPLFLFLLYSGMRVGEVLALSSHDIDFIHKVIHVDNNFYRGELSTPKTNSGFRDIPLTSELESILKSRPLSGDVVFANSLGRRIDYHVLLNAWHRQQNNCGFVTLHGLHSLRHTFATNLISHGADYKTVSVLLGHRDVTTTLNFYAHSDMNQRRNVMTYLNYKIR